MATLAQKRKLLSFLKLLWPPGSGKIVRGVMSTTLGVFWILMVGALVSAATVVVVYLFFSGYVTRVLAAILVNACLSVGVCTDFPALLSALAGSVMILVIVAMTILSSVYSMEAVSPEMSATEISLATLLLNWYCTGDSSRKFLLTLLESSDADLDEDVLQLLRSEHKAMLEVTNGGD